MSGPLKDKKLQKNIYLANTLPYLLAIHQNFTS